MNHAPSETVAIAPRQWPKILTAFRDPSPGRSAWEIAVTAVPFVALWAAMWASLQVGYWLCLLLAIPAGGLLVRLFLIQHDCSHDAFFRRRVTNAWVGRVLGVFTLTPHDWWRRTHAIHHACAGNLDQRGIGDVDTLTVREYQSLSWRGRLGYRLYRHPVVMFGLGPAYLFLLKHRLPVGLMRSGWGPWASAMGTNLATAVLAAGLMWLVGVVPFLMIHLPLALAGATLGVWLFFIQHQFEATSWSSQPAWVHADAALHGSSHYDLPPVLRWFTANVGVHHVHHLCSRIPFYRLPEALKQHPELVGVGRITLWQSFGCVRLTLWDEGARRLVSFRDARAAAAA